MPTLLSLPPELRQHILSRNLPDDVHNAGVAPRTAALLPLLLTCTTVRLDVLQLLKSWSPLYHIEDPHAFFLAALRRRRHRRLYPDADDLTHHMRRVNLRLFAALDLKRMRNAAPMGAFDEASLDVGAWLRCVAALPLPRHPGDGLDVLESVVVDLTPAPAWMSARRPDWVRAAVLDARNKLFLEGCADGVRRVAGAVMEACGGRGGGMGGKGGRGWVEVSLGGSVPRKARRVVEGGMEVGDAGMPAADRVVFAGEWAAGPADEPARLRLGLVCRCWGVDVRSPAVSTRCWAVETRVKQLRSEARKEGLTTPDLDFRALGEVHWSKNSCTAYYVNASEDERRTREDLVHLLAFAVEVRTGTAQPDAAVDFEPAARARRFLLHCLAKDLGLVSFSVGDAGEKFVRVTRPADTPAEERASHGGDGGEEDGAVCGEEEMTPESIRAMELRRAFARRYD